MQARRAARELALILFSQFDKKIAQYNQAEFEDIILKSVRTLTNNAIDELKVSVGAINAMKEYVDTYEAESPVNLSRPLQSNNIPVALPMTSDLSGRLDELLNICEKVVLALEIAEMTALEHTGDVKNYVIEIANTFKEHASEIDGLIQKFAHGWDIDRLVKIDKDILRIAIAELMYIESAPVKVVVDEALELAKKYSKEKNPNLGYFTKQMMVPEFGEAAFKMKKGEVSEKPINSSFGYHIIAVDDVRDTKPLTEEQAAPQIRARMAQELLPSIVGDIMSKAKIEAYQLDGKPMPTTAEAADK